MRAEPIPERVHDSVFFQVGQVKVQMLASSSKTAFVSRGQQRIGIRKSSEALDCRAAHEVDFAGEPFLGCFDAKAWRTSLQS